VSSRQVAKNAKFGVILFFAGLFDLAKDMLCVLREISRLLITAALGFPRLRPF
jgi:hypothetical protein